MHTGIKTWHRLSQGLSYLGSAWQARISLESVEFALLLWRQWWLGSVLVVQCTLSLFERKLAACCAHWGLLGLFASPSHGSFVCFSTWKFCRAETPLSSSPRCPCISASRLCLSLPRAPVRGVQQCLTLVPHQSQSLALGSWVCVAA